MDLHCHPLPAVDDGARTPADGVALLAGLKQIGFDYVVATPHIRSGIWDHRAHTLEPARRLLLEEMARAVERGIALPSLDVAAEHMFDDVTLELFHRGEAMTYPGGRAALIEFPYDTVPVRAELHLWRLVQRGITPVLAHPERCAPLQRSMDRLDEILGVGAKALLDVMSLTGTYGRSAQAAATKFLAAGKYAAACTDAHKPADVDKVAEAIQLLRRTVGEDQLRRLFIVGPRGLLEGRIT